MTRLSVLRYIGVVAVFAGLGLLLLAALRGAAPYSFVSKVGLPGNYTYTLNFPQVWPPRSVEIAVYMEGSGEIDILIFNKAEYEAFTKSKNATPVKEFKMLGSGAARFQVPARGEYYIIARNRGASPVSADIVLTFWGFESDLIYLSTALLVLGASSLISRYFLKKRLSSSLGKASPKCLG